MTLLKNKVALIMFLGCFKFAICAGNIDRELLTSLQFTEEMDTRGRYCKT